MEKFYSKDLAYIHDSGHGEFAKKSSVGLIRIFKKFLANNSHILDLGCGSGILEKELLKSGYKVTGIDYSADMIEIAKENAPEAEYLTGSFFDLDFPSCDAVVSIGECLNYLFDEKNSLETLEKLFKKVFKALKPGGIFLFDFLEPGQLGELNIQNRISEGEDWFIFNNVTEDKETGIFTRSLTIFRKVGELYNKSKEIHRVQLYSRKDISGLLENSGFKVSGLNGYGDFVFKGKHIGFFAEKLN